MQNDQESKSHHGRFEKRVSPSDDWSQREQELTQGFLHSMGGVVQAILGNSELLKIKYAHKLNREAMDHLHKIEENSDDLVRLLREFQRTISTASPSAPHGAQHSVDSGEQG
jgi:uncharacterized protein YwbE